MNQSTKTNVISGINYALAAILLFITLTEVGRNVFSNFIEYILHISPFLVVGLIFAIFAWIIYSSVYYIKQKMFIASNMAILLSIIILLLTFVYIIFDHVSGGLLESIF